MSEELREAGDGVVELKFILPAAREAQLLEWAREHLVPDPHGSGEYGDAYRTTSLYFDTPSFDTYFRVGSYGRSKYRIRRYGDGNVVFAERKLKTRGLISKQRTVVELASLPTLAGTIGGMQQPDMQRSWFVERVRQRRLKNVCQITYDRTARVAMTPNGLVRLTLDRNVRAILNTSSLFQPEHGAVDVATHLILELKYRFATPVMFKRLIADFSLQSSTISKYRLSAAALDLVPEVPEPCQTF